MSSNKTLCDTIKQCLGYDSFHTSILDDSSFMIDPPEITFYGNDDFEHLESTLNEDIDNPPDLSMESLHSNQPLNVSAFSIETPNTSQFSGGSHKKKKNKRSFIKRSRYKRYQKKLNRRALPSLVNNFPSLI